MDELSIKSDRLIRLARETDVRGILLTLQPNFAWLTGGRSNRIDGSREAGAGALLVTAAGRRFVIASRIERARLVDEALGGLGFEAVEYPWTDERADPGLVHRLAAGVAGGGIGTDGSAPDAVPLDGRGRVGDRGRHLGHRDRAAALRGGHGGLELGERELTASRGEAV